MSKTKLKGLSGAKGQAEEVVEPEEKTGFGERVKALRNKLKLGPHHKMERFTILLSVTMSFLLLLTVLSFTGHRANLSAQASDQAVVSTDFTFSLSGQRGAVAGVFGDEDRRDVLVLFQLNDPKGMSLDANKYQLFVTGEKDSMSYEPKVSFALFGATGYGILRFEHDERLNNEVLDITIRSNSGLGTGGPVSGDIADGSFSDFDQARLFVNPGADSITVLDKLEIGEDDPAKLYTALVADTLDAEIRTKITESTTNLSQQLNSADEYKNRLVSAGYTPPETPWFVEGDYIDEDDVFHAAKNLSEAHLVNYADYSIWDGYINQVAGDLSGFNEYISTIKATAETTASKNEAPSEQVENVTSIKHEDGTELDLKTVTTGTSPSAQVAAKDSVDSLTSAWRSYVTEKGKLQRTLMMELLVLDADVLSQPSMYSKNTNDNVATFY